MPDIVTEIGNNAFEHCKNLKSVVLSNSLTTIDEKAFYGCSGLSDITFGENVVEIGPYAFAATAIEELVIPDGVTTIGERAFFNCSNLRKIILPSSIKNIDKDAFNYCNLSDIQYLGTKEQWQKITLGEGWVLETLFCIVHCSNGDIMAY